MGVVLFLYILPPFFISIAFLFCFCLFVCFFSIPLDLIFVFKCRRLHYDDVNNVKMS